MGLVELIAEMPGWVRDAMDDLDDGGKAIADADRGIGNSPKPLRDIERLSMFYLMRATKNARALMEDGEVSPFDEMPNKPVKSWRRKARAFKKSGWIEALGGARMGLRPRGAVVLAANCPETEGREYGIRMWIELIFRDLKSGGWKWEESRV